MHHINSLQTKKGTSFDYCYIFLHNKDNEEMKVMKDSQVFQAKMAERVNQDCQDNLGCQVCQDSPEHQILENKDPKASEAIMDFLVLKVCSYR